MLSSMLIFVNPHFICLSKSLSNARIRFKVKDFTEIIRKQWHQSRLFVYLNYENGTQRFGIIRNCFHIYNISGNISFTLGIIRINENSSYELFSSETISLL